MNASEGRTTDSSMNQAPASSNNDMMSADYNVSTDSSFTADDIPF